MSPWILVLVYLLPSHQITAHHKGLASYAACKTEERKIKDRYLSRGIFRSSLLRMQCVETFGRNQEQLTKNIAASIRRGALK